MFHPRGMGPRGMRPGMRPPFAPRGPPFDPRETEPFFRPPFEDMRGRPGPHIRPPFGPMVVPPTAMHGPDGPWRNQEGGGPLASWSGQESENHSRENHLSRDKQKLAKHQDYKNISERENRNRNRKSRWGNVSPSLTDDVDETLPQEEAENKLDTSDGAGVESNNSFDYKASSSITDQNLLKEQEESITQEQHDVVHSDREKLSSIANSEGGEQSCRNDEVRANPYESNVKSLSSDELIIKQRDEEKRCEYETSIPPEDSIQQGAVQIEQVGHISENHSEQ